MREVIGSATLYLGDCSEVLQHVGKVDAVVTDPPYFGVKDADWDNQWETPAAFLAWISSVMRSLTDRLATNGSLYLFASPDMAGRVEAAMWEHLRVLAHISWRKGAANRTAMGWGKKADKAALRSFLSETERIIFAERWPSGGAGSAVGAAIRAARVSARLKATDVDVALGYVRAKDDTKGTELCRRWEEGSSIPTAGDYARAMLACGDARTPEALQEQYAALVRPFSVTEQEPWSDVWEFDPVAPYPGKHPCEKPLALISHMLRVSTLPGATVLDAFMGGGTTGVACAEMGRTFIGIEKDPSWFDVACRRIDTAQRQHRMFA